MLDLHQFIENCKGQPASAVEKVLVEEALRDPAAFKTALDAEFAGRDLALGGLADLICYRSPALTVLQAATPAKFKTLPP